MNAPKRQYMYIPDINDGVFEQSQSSSSSAENENKQTDDNDSSDCDICECCEVCKPCCDGIGICLSILSQC